MSKLNVELYGTLLGTLTQKAKGLDFEVNPDVFEKYQLSSTIMSISVPLLLRYSIAQKKRTAGYFAELLPEGRNYEWLVQSLPHGDRTTYGMLRKYGKDIAGALTIYDPDDPASQTKAEIESVDGEKIRYLLEHMPQAPLANSIETGKTSLGGVQGKILLAKRDKSWYRVHNGYPSTHILKPVVQDYPTMIYDEAFCMQMAYNAGLTGYPVWIESFDGVDALVIERYDRKNDVDGGRIHQEDFNQALGTRSSEKYQEYGGKVSAKRVAQTLARFGEDDDVERFASQMIFAVAVGNLDMHVKNISILHLPDESIKLAPTYDQVPLRHQSAGARMALSVGGEYIHANISMTNLTSELISWRCRSFVDEELTRAFVKSCLEAFEKALHDTIQCEKAYPSLKTEILSFVKNLMNGKRVGF